MRARPNTDDSRAIQLELAAALDLALEDACTKLMLKRPELSRDICYRAFVEGSIVSLLATLRGRFKEEMLQTVAASLADEAILAVDSGRAVPLDKAAREVKG